MNSGLKSECIVDVGLKTDDLDRKLLKFYLQSFLLGVPVSVFSTGRAMWA